jgi:hypothetical protein
VRRLAVLLPIAAVAGLLVAWRRRRLRAAQAPLAPGASGGAPALPAAAPHAPAPRAPAAAPRAPAVPAVPPLAVISEERFASVSWQLVDAPGDRAQLTVRCAVERGMELDRVDAQETPTQVFVTALTRRREEGASDADAPAPEATVQLSAPLGERELVHAPVDVRAAPGGGPGARPLYS